MLRDFRWRGRRTALFAAICAFTLAVGAAACSAGPSAAPASTLLTPNSPAAAATAGTGTTTAGRTALDNLLPPNLKAKGHLVVGSEISYAPFESYPPDSTTPQGFDVDLGDAIAQRLGVTLDWTNASFTGILAGLDAGRYDLVMSGMTDTSAREKEADFVDYASQSDAVLVPPGNPSHIHSLADLCGQTVGAEEGSTQEKILGPQSARCTAAGKPGIKFTYFQSVPQVYLAVSTDRVPVAVEPPIPSAAYASAHPGSFQIAFSFPIGILGIAIPKNSDKLASALKASLQSLIDNGTYSRLIAKWHLPPSVALKTATINGGASDND